MRRRGRPGLAALLLLAGASPAVAQGPASVRVETSPSPPSRGNVVWLYARPVGAPDTATTLDGSAAGEPLHFERRADGRFRSLLGIPLDGDDTLPVTLRLSTGAVTDTLVVGLAVRVPAHPNERLRVAPQYAEPDSAARARVEGELAQSRAISRQAHISRRHNDEMQLTSGGLSALRALLH